MRKLFNIFALIASVMFVVGCEPVNPTPEPTPGEKPQITLTAGEVTADSFTFEVSSSTAGTLGYAVVAKGYTNPTIDEIFARNSKDIEQKATITVDNLNGGTEYTLFAVLRAKNDGVLSTPQKLAFTTAADDSNNPIKIKNIGYNNVTFSIDLPGNILFQCIDKASLEFYGQTVEDYFSTEGIAIRDNGPIEVEWIDGGRYSDYDTRMREDSDYYIIASKSDGSTPYPNIVGDIYVKEFRTLCKPSSNETITAEITDITSTSARIKSTPSSAVTEYWVWVRSVADYEYYYSNGGSAIIKSIIQRGDSGSWRLTSANNAVCEGLTPNTDYYCITYLKDNKGGDALVTIPFTTTDKMLKAPEITMSITKPAENAHNTLNLNLYSEGATTVNVVFRPTPELMERRYEDGYDDEYIASNMGTPLSAEQVAAVASTGLTLKMEGLWPEVEYTALVIVKNAEKTATVKAAATYTSAQAPAPRVESNLFTSLVGEWRLTYDLVQENLVEARVSEVVTIAQGVDEKSSTDYRNQNRLVILGFPFEVTAQGVYEKVPVYLPADLLKARPNYYENNENLLYRDYGPKIFLEIGEGDTLSVPSSNTCPLFNWSLDGAFYFVGGDFSARGAAPATFPVTLSADGNTLVIGACNAGEEFMYGTYLPSVYLDNSATPRMEAWGVSDVILERVK